MTSKRVSIVIPCFNERENIMPLWERLSTVLPTVSSDWEVVYVNNGSDDGSDALFDQLAGAEPRITIVTLSRNFGFQSAYSSGLDVASGDCVVCMDGDLQDPPELLPALVEKWLSGYKVVYGERIKRRDTKLGMRFAYKAFYRLFQAMSYIDIPLDAGDFGLMDRRVVDIINAMPERNRFVRGLRAWTGFKQTGIPYERDQRTAGRSSNSLVDLFRWASTGLVSFSFAPLELISILAFIVVGLAVVAIIVYLGIYLANPSQPRGFETLIVVMLFLGAVQLLCISIIASYLAKMFEEVKGRPSYIVAHIQNDHRRTVDGHGLATSVTDRKAGARHKVGRS